VLATTLRQREKGTEVSLRPCSCMMKHQRRKKVAPAKRIFLKKKTTPSRRIVRGLGGRCRGSLIAFLPLDAGQVDAVQQHGQIGTPNLQPLLAHRARPRQPRTLRQLRKYASRPVKYIRPMGGVLQGNAVRRRRISRGNLMRARCIATEGVMAQARPLARERSAWTRRLGWPIASGEAAIPPGAQRGASAGARTHYASTRTCRCADTCTSP
jgi:hypothetical protein